MTDKIFEEFKKENMAGGRSEECTKIMYQVSLLIESLNLNEEIEDKLLEMLAKLVYVAEGDAFTRGINSAQQSNEQ